MEAELPYYLRAELNFTAGMQQIVLYKMELTTLLAEFQLHAKTMQADEGSSELVEIMEDTEHKLFELIGELDDREEDYAEMKELLLSWRQAKDDIENAFFINVFEERMDCLDFDHLQTQIRGLNVSLRLTEILVERIKEKSGQQT